MGATLRFARLLVAAVLLLAAANMPCEAKLTHDFYRRACPSALPTIRTAVRRAIARERRMAASLIRLHFHDCFVQGCDGSVLLDDCPEIVSEKNSHQNFHSLRGFEFVDDVKSRVEHICPGVVSCADILAVAARDASEYVGGPTWKVKLGRRDSTSASKRRAERNLPKFTYSLRRLRSLFARKGLSTRDMVALSGAHTIGQAACINFRDRVHNATNIDAEFASTRRRRCPAVGGDGNLAPLDPVTPTSFDQNYFKNLIQKRGLLASDQVLFSGRSTDRIVIEYSRNRTSFFADFAAAMVRMGNIKPLTGSSGEVRRVCSVTNG